MANTSQSSCTCDSAAPGASFLTVNDVIKLAAEHSFNSRFPPRVIRRWRMDSAILRLHTRKVSALTFWPDKEKQLLVSGDKRGRVAVLDFSSTGHCRNLFENAHSLLIRDIVFTDKERRAASPCCVTASADGCAKLLNLEIGTCETVFDLNSISNSLPLIGTATQQLLSRSWCSLCSLTVLTLFSCHCSIIIIGGLRDGPIWGGGGGGGGGKKKSLFFCFFFFF